jgi:hypothetical protein
MSYRVAQLTQSRDLAILKALLKVFAVTRYGDSRELTAGNRLGPLWCGRLCQADLRMT